MTRFSVRLKRALRALVARLRPGLLRPVAITLVALATLFFAFRLAAPFLISTTLVRSGMETAISQWTGHRAVIGGRPQLEFWPEPRITLEDVSIQRQAAGDDRTIASVERLSASFSLWQALSGNPVFYDFHFIRPHLFLTRDSKGMVDWASDGLLGTAIREARPAGEGQLLSKSLNARIGAMRVEDGTLELRDKAGNHAYRIDGISADVEWPTLADGLRITALMRLRNHDVKLDLASSQPLLLFAGRNADAAATITAPALAAHFEGIANLAAYAFLSGEIEAAATDIPALLAWSGARLPSVEKLKSASLAAQIVTMGDVLRFNELKFTIDEATATGVMDLSMPDTGRAKVTGTLAFDTLNIRSFLAAFALDVDDDAAPSETADTAFMRQLDLDLRLSATTAAFAPFTVTEVGASVLINDGEANFDIVDSVYEGGTLTAHLDVSERGFQDGGNMRVSVRDADLEAAVRDAELSGPLPLGPGSLDLSLSTKKPIWATGPSDVSGTFRLFGGGGRLRQFDAATLRALAAEKPFFKASDMAAQAFDYDSVELKAVFANGSADVSSAAFVGKSQTLLLSGVIPYSTRGLALAGALQPALSATDAASLPPLQFFIGGSWPDPVLSPVRMLTGPSLP